MLAARGLSPAARDEVVQDVMLRVWRKAHLYDPSRAAVSTWIYTLARNAHIDRTRRRRATLDEADPTFVEDPSPSPVAQLLRVHEGARIREALSRLPAVQADVLRGAYFEHKSLPQIAQESNVPLGTVKSRVRLAFRSLRRTLGDEQ